VAHDKGIFHRDLKPENIMLQSFAGGEEQVKIIDFGIAKLKNSTVAPSTMTGATAGTGRLHGAGATERPADVRRQLTSTRSGRSPLRSSPAANLLIPRPDLNCSRCNGSGVRVSPIDLRPAVTQEANDLILRALNFDPSVRFRTAREFGDALAHALLGRDDWRAQTGRARSHSRDPSSRRRRIRPRAKLPISRRRQSPVVSNRHRSTR
jgi:serine/threonine-protein kinase